MLGDRCYLGLISGSSKGLEDAKDCRQNVCCLIEIVYRCWSSNRPSISLVRPRCPGGRCYHQVIGGSSECHGDPMECGLNVLSLIEIVYGGRSRTLGTCRGPAEDWPRYRPYANWLVSSQACHRDSERSRVQGDARECELVPT